MSADRITSQEINTTSVEGEEHDKETAKDAIGKETLGLGEAIINQTLEEKAASFVERCCLDNKLNCPPEYRAEVADFLSMSMEGMAFPPTTEEHGILLEEAMSCIDMMVPAEVLKAEDVRLAEKEVEQGKQEQHKEVEGSELAHGNELKKDKSAENQETIESQEAVIANYLQEIGSKTLSELTGEGGVRARIKADETLNEKEGLRTDILVKIDDIIAKVKSVKNILRPEERKLIDTAVINVGGSSNAEIYSGIFDAINAGIQDEDRKKELQEQVAEKLGIPVPFKHDLDTGSDVTEAILSGYGLDENGKKIEYTEKNKLQVRPGISVYPKQGDLMIKAKLFGGRELLFKTSIVDSDLNEKINMVITMYLAEMKGLTGVTHDQGTFATQGGEVIDLDGAGLLNDKTAQFSRAVFEHFIGGLTADVNQRLMTQDEMKRVDWAFQWFRKDQGDITGGSDGGHEKNDEEGAKNDQEELGIIDGSGNLRVERLETALEFVALQKTEGEPNFEALKKHLDEVYPPEGGDGEDTEASKKEEDTK